MLDSTIKNQLSSHFSALTGNIELVLALDESNKSKELDTLANDLAELSPRISIRQDHQAARRPAMQVLGEQGTSITFAGVPMGHEFTSLVLAVLHSGGVATKADEAQRTQIQALDKALNFEIYISLSCQTCPAVVQALNTMAALNPQVNVTMIDGALFQEGGATHANPSLR